MGSASFAVDEHTNQLDLPSDYYDGAGNLLQWGDGVSQSTVWFTYYPTNLMETKRGDTWSSVYGYSADGERVARYDDDLTDGPDGTSYVIRDLSGKPLREYYQYGCDTPVWQKDWIWRNGLALAADDGNGFRFFHLDHLGTPRRITNASGYLDSLGVHDYYPFGTETPDSSLDGEAIKFTGHERDLGILGETFEDLDYMHARYYSSNLGRFLSVDPVGGTVDSSQSWNRYSYVRNNPIRAIDPNGEDLIDVVNGVANGLGSTLLANSGRRQPLNSDYQLGQTIGDIAATTIGLLEIIAGSGGQAGSAALAGSGGGAPAGVITAAGSTALVAHGTVTTSTGVANLLGSPMMRGRASEGGGEVNRGNLKVVKDKELKRKGVDAHQVKRDELGRRAKISEWDIATDKSGRAYLLSKDGKKIKDLGGMLDDFGTN
jgi:RHS repeat-associated protein